MEELERPTRCFPILGEFQVGVGRSSIQRFLLESEVEMTEGTRIPDLTAMTERLDKEVNPCMLLGAGRET